MMKGDHGQTNQFNWGALDGTYASHAPQVTTSSVYVCMSVYVCVYVYMCMRMCMIVYVCLQSSCNQSFYRQMG